MSTLSGNRRRAELGQVKIRALVQPRTAALFMFLGTFCLWLGNSIAAAYVVFLISHRNDSDMFNKVFLICSGLNAIFAILVVRWAYCRQKRRWAAEDRRIREADAG